MDVGVANRLVTSRKAIGMTQKDLAAATGLAQSTISAIEIGRTVEPTNIIKLATALGVRPYWLSTGKEPPPEGISSKAVEKIVIKCFQNMNLAGQKVTPEALGCLVRRVVEMGNKFLGGKPWTDELLRMAIGNCLEQSPDIDNSKIH